MEADVIIKSVRWHPYPFNHIIYIDCYAADPWHNVLILLARQCKGLLVQFCINYM